MENKRQLKDKRLTIGYLDENGNDEYHGFITKGMIETATKHDANIIRFSHFTSNMTNKHELHINMILEFIEQFQLDGLIFLGWARAISQENHESFKKRFSKTPLFALGSGFSDIPNAYFPGDLYLKELLVHLIEIHHCNKIAFIAPFWSDNRGKIYTDMMKEHGIYNPDLYISEEELTGIEVPERGRKAVSILIDKRKLAFDAIVSLFNAETEGIINELYSRGINVPKDVAVTSYEDGELGKFSIPSYTTVYFPWRELGSVSCEKMVELLTKGHIQNFNIVPGKVVIRESCGCMTSSVRNVQPTGPAANFKDLGVDELKRMQREISSKVTNNFLNIEIMLESLYDDLRGASDQKFLYEMEDQLRNIPSNTEIYDLDDIVTLIRNSIIPYLLNEQNILFNAEEILLKAQNLIKERQRSVWTSRQRQLRKINENLQETSYILLNIFSIKSLMESLEVNLPKLNIQGCYIFLFNEKNLKYSLFDNCSLIFEYTDNKRVKTKAKNPCTAKEKISEILSNKGKKYALIANLLNVGNDFTGFVIYEPGPLDERVYQVLSTNISTALSVAILLERLDDNYKKLIDQAHKEGMANIATGILHNIRNIINSAALSTNLMGDIVNDSPLEDFLKSTKLLEENMNDLESFVRNNSKGKKLMQYFVKLGDQLEDLKANIKSHIERLSDKVTLIDDVLKSQQSYTSVKSVMEEGDISEIIENSIKINQSLLEELKIRVIKEYNDTTNIKIHKVKLFHVISNLVKNAAEALQETNDIERIIKISVSKNNKETNIKISDNGCGIQKEKIKSIFAYGHTTKKNGHGFGLHSCANYVGEMGGKIWAESNGPGKGATFSIQFIDN